LSDHGGPALDPNPDRLIAALGLAPHPEGGHFAETFRDRPADGSRGAVTCIHYLLRRGEVSRWHRIDATEIWHYQAGDALELAIEGAVYRLGPDPLTGDRGHVVVPPHAWQSARPLGAWTLVSCTVAPAFELAGFELAPEGWSPLTPAARSSGS
jgi:uncharacterized protein